MGVPVLGAPRFGSVVTAMVTPFTPEGLLDLDGAMALARWLADHGSDSVVVAGSTGEGTLLTDSERSELCRAVRSAVNIPVLAATGAAGTAHSVQLTQDAQAAGVDGVLVVTPYYARPSQDGLYAHFRAVAGATSLPVMLYDIPARSGRKIATSTTLRLVEDAPNVVAVKDAAGDVSTTASLIAQAPADFEVYCGDDSLTLPMLAVGAVGLVSVASHWAGQEIGDMIASFAKGDIRAAVDANRRLIPSWEFESGDLAPNPIPAKAMLALLGQPAGPCRLPLGEIPGWVTERARDVLAGLGRVP